MKKEALKPKGNLHIKHDHLLSYKLLAYLPVCMPFIQISKHLWSIQYFLTLCPSYSPLPQLPFLSLAQHTPTSGTCYPFSALQTDKGELVPPSSVHVISIIGPGNLHVCLFSQNLAPKGLPLGNKCCVPPTWGYQSLRGYYLDEFYYQMLFCSYTIPFMHSLWTCVVHESLWD